MNTRAIPPLIGVPVIWLASNSLSLVCLHQLIVVLHPHTSSKDFADARHKHVDRLRDTAIALIFPHVERLDLNREMSQEDWNIEDIRHLALSSFRNIVTKMVRVAVFIEDVVFDEPGDGISILHTLEWSGWRFEVGVKFFDVSCYGWVCECYFKDAADNCLNVLEQVVESNEIEFRFDMCVFGQMPARGTSRRGRRAQHKKRLQGMEGRSRGKVATIA